MQLVRLKTIFFRETGISRIGITFLLPFILLAVAYVVYKLFLIPDPVVTDTRDFEFLPLDKTIRLQAENIKSINITAYQNGKTFELLNDTPDTSQKTYMLQIKPKDLKMKNGPALLIVVARAGIFKKVQYEIKSLIDTVPPALEVIKSPLFVHQGGGGFAVLKAKDADSVYIKLVEKTFNAFRAQSDEKVYTDVYEMAAQQAKINSRKQESSLYYAFFPVPFDTNESSTFYAVAKDMAGNKNIRSLSTKLKLKKFKTSSINISDSFINTVIASLLNVTSISDPEGAFRKVNEDWRKENLEKLLEIAGESEPTMLWEGRFLQLKNSKVMAVYGDKRTYSYKNNVISKSVHLGYDLASFAGAPVEASNTGIVRHAEDLGIYGNTIILDHGLGLMSLYGHLSEIQVQEGQTVKKGQIIAKTGSSGLAGGDHLHFGILMHGYEVSPLYWWDKHWIKVNIRDHLNYK